MNTEDKKEVVMYDSPEAAYYKEGISGWVSRGGFFCGQDEEMARYRGCTHKTCECGKPMEKEWLRCEECRWNAKRKKYLALPYEEYDGKKYVVDWDGDQYFWSEEDLIEYMDENDIEEIDLLICQPVCYQTIDSETVASDAHEDWEPDKELLEKIEEFNKYLQTLPPHSWEPGNIRTSYKYIREEEND